MNPTLIYAAICVVLILLLMEIRIRRSKEEQSATGEYWVYVKKEALPNQQQLKKDLFSRWAVSPQEALLFSDVRLNFVLVLASKNPHLFHTDVLEEAVPIGDPLWSQCAAAPGLAMIRFVGAKPEEDSRYLSLLPHLAVSISRLAGGVGILDVGQRKLFDPDEFQKSLEAIEDASSASIHVRTHWQEFPVPEAHSWGLSKIGLKEVTTGPMEQDFKLMAGRLLMEAASSIWKRRSVPEQMDFELYGQHYRIIPGKGRRRNLNGRLHLRIYKVGQE